MSWTALSIIGSAGRNEDAAKVSKERFTSMGHDAHETITKKLKLDPKSVILVSGGAAFGDHVAVKLFLEYGYPRLRLFLPCEWRTSTGSARSSAATRLPTSTTSIVKTGTNIFVKATVKRKYVDE